MNTCTSHRTTVAVNFSKQETARLRLFVRYAMFSLVLLLALFACRVTLNAQNTLPPPPPPMRPTPQPLPQNPPTADEPQGQEVDEGDEISISTSLVNLQVRVVDRQNRPVNNLSRNDFQVFEDGAPQKIEFFTTEEVPISYGIVIDNSGSLRQQLDKVIGAGKTLVESNKQGDETFFIRFTNKDNIKLEQEWTSDKETLIDALDDLFIDAGQTAVHDAVFLAADYAGERRKNERDDRRRRAVILVTDGENRDSTYDEKELFARLRESDVQIFVIGFVNDLDDQNSGIIKKSDRSRAVSLINKLATETGGRAFFPNSIDEVPAIAQEINRDLRTQFVVSYSPTNKKRDGTYRRVRVAIAGDTKDAKRIAVTRPGYTAPNDNATTQPVRPVAPNTRRN